MAANDAHVIKQFDVQLLSDIKNCQNDNVISALELGNLYQAADRSGRTLLHYAVECGNDIVLEHLINKGANIDAQDKSGKTPLMLSLQREDRLSATKILLEAGANIFMPQSNNEEKLSSFEMAVCNCKDEAVLEMFFERVKKKYNVLEYVLLLNKPFITRHILDKGYSPNSCDSKNGRTMLQIAILKRNLENLQLLLNYKADVNMKDNFGMTPIMIFNITDHSEENLNMLRLFRSRNPDLYLTNLNGRTILEIIILNGHPKFVAALLEGMDLSEVGRSGRAPLHYLAKRNDIEEIKIGLQNIEFDVNIPDGVNGNTPLHMAAFYGLPNAVAYLLKIGATVDVRNLSDLTPTMCVISSQINNNNEKLRKRKCLDLLMRAGANVEYKIDMWRWTLQGILRLSVKYPLANHVFMHLTIREACGRPITAANLRVINSDNFSTRILQSYRQGMKNMKSIRVYEQITQFTLLAESEQNVIRYLRNPSIAQRYRGLEYYPGNYCFWILGCRLERLLRLVDLQQNATVSINGVMTRWDNSLNHYDVSYIISKYLNEKDATNFLRGLED